MNEPADEITHPRGESVESTAKIVANRLSLFWVFQDLSDFLKDRSPSAASMSWIQ